MKRVLFLILFAITFTSMYGCKVKKEALSDTLIYQRDSLFIEGIRLKQQKLYDSAYVAFSKADSIDSRNPAICYELGNRLLAKDFEAGLEYLERAVSLSKDNYYYRKSVVSANLMKKDLDSAVDKYEALLKQFPDHEGDLYDLAELYARKGDYKKSIKTFERLERLTGTDKYISLSKVGVFISAGELDDALKELDKILKEMPLDASVWSYKGDIYMETKDMDLALECYEKALELDPDNGYALESMYVYYIRTGESDKANEIMFRIFTCEQIQYSRKKEYLNQIARYYVATQRPYSELDTIYRSIIASDPENSDALLQYSDYLIQMKRNDEAIETLRSAVYLDPQCQMCWEYLLYQMAASSDSAMVEKVLEDAMEAIPESAEFHYYSGLWNYSKNHDEDAIKFMLKADSIVEASGRKALTEDNRKDLWNFLFVYYYKNGQKEQCYKYLDRHLEAFPNDIGALNNYAYILATDGVDLDKAEALSKKTIEKEPLEPVYLDTYAYILMKKGKLTYAKFYIEQAIEYMKSAPDAVIYEHYGDILFLSGNVDTAVEYWKKSLEIERDGQDKDKLKIKINTRQYVE